MVRSAIHSVGITPASWAAPNTTKANSPPCESSTANSRRCLVVMPKSRAVIHKVIILMVKKPATSRATVKGLLTSKPKSIDMPTEIKKSPSSSPLNGSISLSSAWRYSELASNTPARNAPSAIDKPASVISWAMPITNSKAKAVNTSRKSVEATIRNAGRVRYRPIKTTPNIAPAAFNASNQKGSGLAAAPTANSGITANRGIAATS